MLICRNKLGCRIQHVNSCLIYFSFCEEWFQFACESIVDQKPFQFTCLNASNRQGKAVKNSQLVHRHLKRRGPFEHFHNPELWLEYLLLLVMYSSINFINSCPGLKLEADEIYLNNNSQDMEIQRGECPVILKALLLIF